MQRTSREMRLCIESIPKSIRNLCVHIPKVLVGVFLCKTEPRVDRYVFQILVKTNPWHFGCYQPSVSLVVTVVVRSRYSCYSFLLPIFVPQLGVPEDTEVQRHRNGCARPCPRSCRPCRRTKDASQCLQCLHSVYNVYIFDSEHVEFPHWVRDP